MRKVSALLLSASALLASGVNAEQPFGWIGNGHTSAYTLGPGETELSGNLLLVDDTIDVLNFRDEFLAGNSRLIDNSGDLDGWRGELRLGIWRGLELFYRQQDQDLTLKVNQPASVNILDLSQGLSTRSTDWGAKWVFFESTAIDQTRPWTSAALELTHTENISDDFDGYLESFQFNASTNIRFEPPQRFAMDRLRDEGWRARIIMTRPILPNVALSAWAGYGKSESSSGTSTEIDLQFLRDQFLQTFDLEENYLLLGASLSWQLLPRLPLQAGYEYIRINARRQDINSSDSSLIPSFLRGNDLGNSATTNHTVYANINWWVTPRIHIGLGGKLFANQFVGVIPHYNNPLSGSFSDIPYGYAELKLGIRLSVADFARR
ncbi:hypothetical protein [Pseudohongiella sp.]|uniref:DUF5723 domain-containing protein n=1 Tax=marine sediment metagenome TaxID=412755 RepID=A0A0F9W3I8_9ZZZZ|nr:hypothetical protein [Pseudohongiella sp.]HDZ08962.1 hypothetical protein [Pseudohongiella sp.]HEA62647.1 hypothetical protein [Pseudohongiella sp.]